MKFRSIRIKLLGAFLGVSLGVAAVTIVGYRGVQALVVQLDEAAGNQVPSLLGLSDVNAGFLSAISETRVGFTWMQRKDQARLAAVKKLRDESLARVQKGIKRYEPLPMKPEEEALWKKFRAAWDTWMPINDRQWDALLAADDTRTGELLLKAQGPISEARAALRQVIALQETFAHNAEKAGKDAAQGATRGVLISASISLIFAIFIALMLTRAIAGPVGRMRDAAARIAQGDVDQRIDHRSADEVGQLADSFRQQLDYIQGISKAAAAIAAGDLSTTVQPRSGADALSKNMNTIVETLKNPVLEIKRLVGDAAAGKLDARTRTAAFTGAFREQMEGINQMLDDLLKPVNEAVAVMERVAQRDLTARIRGDYRGDHARLKTAVNQAVENLDQGLSQVATATHEVRSASTQIASSSQSLSSGASEQASSLAETRSSLEEMSRNTQRNAENAQSADGLASGARKASDHGASSMKAMLDAMRKIRGAAESTAEIIRDINEIAFQTNLLALNAAVEAARAGDAGRGFAVVADEVRSLAMRAKEAAKKTESLIHESVELAASGEQISNDVGESLGAIVSSVGQVSGIVGSIATASGEQSRGIEQVTIAVTQMDQVTQTNAAGAEELSSTAEELSAQAEELAALVSRFQLSVASATTVHAPSAPVHRAAPQRLGASAPRQASARVAAAAKSKAANAPVRAVASAGFDPLPMGDDAFNDF